MESIKFSKYSEIKVRSSRSSAPASAMRCTACTARADVGISARSVSQRIRAPAQTRYMTLDGLYHQKSQVNVELEAQLKDERARVAALTAALERLSRSGSGGGGGGGAGGSAERPGGEITVKALIH